MKAYVQKLLLLFFLSLCAISGHGQEKFYVDINVSNSSPSVNQQIRIDYKLKFKGSSGSFTFNNMRFNRPDFEGFKIIDQGGRMDMGMNFGMGRDDMTLYVYSFILEATDQGTFTIEPFEFIWSNHRVKSAELSLVVGKGENIQKPGKKQKDEHGISGDDLFARTIISKNTVYKGEPVVVTHKFYSKKTISGLSPENMPSYDGFWVEDIDIGELSVQQERIDGSVYNVVTISKKVLFPQKSGKLKIGGFSLNTTVQVEDVRKARNSHERFFYGDRIRTRKNVKKVIRSPGEQITVKALPAEGKTDSFTGHAGSFRLSSEITKDTVTVNQSTNLKLTLSGTGNINLVDLEGLVIPPAFEIYEPDIDKQSTVNAGGVSGTKTWNYLLIPRNEGTFTIEPIEFTYFDILKKQYVTLKTKAFTIHVLKGDGTTAGPSIKAYGKEDIERPGTDIMHIYEPPLSLHPKNRNFVNTFRFWMFLIIPVVAFVIFYLFYKKHQRIQSNAALLKTKRATRLAQKRLKKARKYKDSDDDTAFYEEVNRAILGYISDRFNLTMSDLSRETISQQLQNRAIKAEHIQETTLLLDNCDYARFAPAATPADNKESIYQQALSLISKIEKDLK
ncbi:MAG: BatD family protein [Bacteroidales bacterium]